MLSDSKGGDFQGGTMQGTVVAKNAPGKAPPKEVVSTVPFEKGDCLVFLSDKNHSVAKVEGGTRRVLVIEFWDGPRCICNHRCMGRPPCGIEERCSSGSGGSEEADVALAVGAWKG